MARSQGPGSLQKTLKRQVLPWGCRMAPNLALFSRTACRGSAQGTMPKLSASSLSLHLLYPVSYLLAPNPIVSGGAQIASCHFPGLRCPTVKLEGRKPWIPGAAIRWPLEELDKSLPQKRNLEEGGGEVSWG